MILNAEDTAAECINCGLCAQLCPSNLQPQELWRFTRARQLPPDKLGLQHCVLCSVCDYVCPSDLALAASFKEGQRLASALAEREQRAQRALQRYRARQQRQQLEHERLAQRREQAWQQPRQRTRSRPADTTALQIQKCERLLQRLPPDDTNYSKLSLRLQELRSQQQ